MGAYIANLVEEASAALAFTSGVNEDQPFLDRAADRLVRALDITVNDIGSTARSVLLPADQRIRGFVHSAVIEGFNTRSVLIKDTSPTALARTVQSLTELIIGNENSRLYKGLKSIDASKMHSIKPMKKAEDALDTVVSMLAAFHKEADVRLANHQAVAYRRPSVILLPRDVVTACLTRGITRLEGAELLPHSAPRSAYLLPEKSVLGTLLPTSVKLTSVRNTKDGMRMDLQFDMRATFNKEALVIGNTW